MKNKQEIIDALKEFVKAGDNLSELWQHSGYTLHKNYPFEMDFDEVISDIHKWVKTSIEDIKTN